MYLGGWAIAWVDCFDSEEAFFGLFTSDILNISYTILCLSLSCGFSLKGPKLLKSRGMAYVALVVSMRHDITILSFAPFLLYTYR